MVSMSAKKDIMKKNVEAFEDELLEVVVLY